MENNSQPPAPAAPAKVTPSATKPPKTTQASSNHELVPMAARAAATDGSAPHPRGTAVGAAPLRSVEQHSQPLSSSMLQVHAVAGTGTGSMYGTTTQFGAAMPRSPTASARAVRPTTKLMIKRPPSPPPPKLPVYRPPPPPRPESSSAAGNALLPSPSDIGFRVSNMKAVPPSPVQVTVAKEGSDSEGGGGRRDDMEMLDLNFPPVSDNEEN